MGCAGRVTLGDAGTWVVLVRAPNPRGVWDPPIEQLPGSPMARRSVTDDRKKLRAEAEARFARDPKAPGSSQAASALLHELQVHQIELEMQNEELRRNQLELEEAHARLVDLYDFAPVGYLSLDDGGRITGANLTAATLLGTERRSLMGRPFAGVVTRADGERWHRYFSACRLLEERTGSRLRLTRGDGAIFDAHVSSERRPAGPEGSQIRIVLTDVTEFARVDQALRETKERLSHVLDGANEGFWDVDIPTGKVKFSRRWAAMIGLDLDEIEPTMDGWGKRIHPEDRARVMAAVDAHLRGESSHYVCEHRLRHKDGRWVWVLAKGQVVERDLAGNPVRAAGTNTDISDRKAAEDVVRRSQATYAAMARNFPGGAIGIFDQDLRYTFVDGRGASVTGVPPSSLVGRTVFEIYPPPQRERIAEAFRAALRGQTMDFELSLAGRVMEIRSGPVTDDDGRVLLGIATSQDVTDRHRVQDALAASERRYRDLLEHSPSPVFINRGNRIEFVNRVGLELFGADRPEQLLGKSPFDLFHPDFHGQLRERIETVLGGGTAGPGEMRILRLDGTTRDVVTAGALYRDSNGPATQVVLHDVTERRRLESELRASEARFRTLADASPVGIFQTDAAGRNVYLNAVGERLLGQSPEEARGSGWEGAIHPDDRERVLREWGDAVANEKVFQSEYRYLHRDGRMVSGPGARNGPPRPARSDHRLHRGGHGLHRAEGTGSAVRACLPPLRTGNARGGGCPRDQQPAHRGDVGAGPGPGGCPGGQEATPGEDPDRHRGEPEGPRRCHRRPGGRPGGREASREDRPGSGPVRPSERHAVDRPPPGCGGRGDAVAPGFHARRRGRGGGRPGRTGRTGLGGADRPGGVEPGLECDEGDAPWHEGQGRGPHRRRAGGGAVLEVVDQGVGIAPGSFPASSTRSSRRARRGKGVAAVSAWRSHMPSWRSTEGPSRSRASSGKARRSAWSCPQRLRGRDARSSGGEEERFRALHAQAGGVRAEDVRQEALRLRGAMRALLGGRQPREPAVERLPFLVVARPVRRVR